MGKCKGKKSLSRRARQEYRLAREARQAKQAQQKKFVVTNRQKEDRQYKEELRKKKQLDLEALMVAVGWPVVDRDTRRRFRGLVEVARDNRQGLLGVPYLIGLANLARVSHVRRPDQWVPEGRGLTSAFRSLATHVLGGYRANGHLIDGLMAYDTGEMFLKGWVGTAESLARLVKVVISGGRVINLVGTSILPAPLTRRMCHILVNPDRALKLPQLARRAQVLGHGGGVSLVKAVCEGPLGTFRSRNKEIFWDEVIHWFCRQEDLDPAQVGPVCDFIDRRVTEEGDYSLKGRTWSSVVSGMEKWHKELNDLKRFKSLADFRASGYASSLWKKTKLVDGQEVPSETWVLQEIRNPRQLVTEGSIMGHCVADYHSAIMSGKSSIWSLSMNDGRRLTIEVHNLKKQVVQVRGKFNRLPRAGERRFVRGWARKNGLAINSYEMDNGR